MDYRLASGSELDCSTTDYPTDGTDNGSATGTDYTADHGFQMEPFNFGSFEIDWEEIEDSRDSFLFGNAPEDEVTYSIQKFIADMSPYSIIRYWKAPDYMSMKVFLSQDVNPTTTTSSYAILPASGNPSSERIKEKIAIALEHFLIAPRHNNILIQFWAPFMIGDKFYLKTVDQTFGLGQIDKHLCNYKIHGQTYAYNLEGEENTGVPGRVYKSGWPEYTPNVNYYTVTEYPHSDYADVCGIRRCFALPIYEPAGKNCVGVLELVDTDKGGQVENVITAAHRALKAAKLESTYMYYNESKIQTPQQETVEIGKVLRALGARFRNLLAQVWVPCKREVVATAPESSFNLCCPEEVLSIVDISTPHNHFPERLPFLKQCREHLLKKGQGVVGRAAEACKPCFCSDITKLTTTDYPLTHYAQTSGLTASFAIFLQSTTPENTNYYVVELFIISPEPDDNDSEIPRELLGSILATMRLHLTSFKFSSGEEPSEENVVEVINLSTNGNGKQQLLKIEEGSSKTSSLSLEVLEQHFQMKLDDAANSLGVSRSTLKRACRQHGVVRWPTSKRNSVSRSPPNRQVKKFVQSNRKEIVASSSVPSSVRVKGIYGDEIIVFWFSILSGIKGLKDNITRRLPLEDTGFKVKYEDDEGDLVLISCDDDLQTCVDSYTSYSFKTCLKIMIISVP